MTDEHQARALVCALLAVCWAALVMLRVKDGGRRRDRANGKPSVCKRCGATYPEGEGCALC